MPPDVEPVTAAEAARRLGKAPPTIHVWALRYNALQLGKVGRRVYYDFGDLARIDRQLRNGLPVPPTPQQRAELRPTRPANHAA